MNKKIIYLEVILLILLVLTNLAISYRDNQFKRDCKVTYKNDSCPCKKIEIKNTNEINISKDLEIIDR